MPPKVEMSFVNNLAKSFARGQPYTRRIGLTLFRDQVHNSLKKYTFTFYKMRLTKVINGKIYLKKA
jgi:hypothetical protein